MKKSVVRSYEGKPQVNLTKHFENFGTKLLGYAQILQKTSSYMFACALNILLDTRKYGFS